MLLNIDTLIDTEAYFIKQFTKCREKISLEENTRIIHLKILACFERVREMLDN